MGLGLLLACTTDDDDDDATVDDDDVGDDDDVLPELIEVTILATLDGEPTAGISVFQGGLEERHETDADGLVTFSVLTTVDQELWLLGAHPEARTTALPSPDETPAEPLAMSLTRYDPSDNPEYVFKPPGDPPQGGTTELCNHCHVTMTVDWHESPHRTSASSPTVQDLYAGAVAALTSEADCTAAGGSWWTGIGPGTAAPADRCYLGDGALPALNAGCGDEGPCDETATAFGGCADCHAPGIDGELGGRSLLEATELAYDKGVHCDVCHHVEAVDLEQPAGVAGRLVMVRPSEAINPPLGPWLPLVFGPRDDVANPAMGGVYRDHFATSLLCAGCHQYDQQVLVPDATIDLDRWPDGTLPIHSTYDEWVAGGDPTTCQGCHMPADEVATNGADLQMWGIPAGLAAGWLRPEGSVRRHSFTGPRDPAGLLLPNAALMSLETVLEDGDLVVTVETRNPSHGHRLPTGEPMRTLLLVVEATCDDEPLLAAGGHAVPDFGGYHAMQNDAGDWSQWPGAEVGQVVRVVARSDAFHDYPGFGPFGDGTFDAEGKGMPIDEAVGFSTITAVDGDTVTFDVPLPAGDIAYLTDSGLPADDDASVAVAGAPGFGFARVLVGADGDRMVPHYAAVDVASDNRIGPDSTWSSEHRFAATCAEPAARAALIWRQYSWDLATDKRWPATDIVIREASAP